MAAIVAIRPVDVLLLAVDVPLDHVGYLQVFSRPCQPVGKHREYSSLIQVNPGQFDAQAFLIERCEHV